MANDTADTAGKAKYAEKLRMYQLRKGAHKMKNRSSKHIKWLKELKDIYRCLSGEQLNDMSKNGNFEAEVELNRRAKKRAKKQGLQG